MNIDFRVSNTKDMDKQIKILLCGDVEGNFNTLFKRVESINSKSGPFELLLCVGNFFGKDNKELSPYKTRVKTVPVLTYVLGPNDEDSSRFYPEHDDEEICPNVFYLGKRGLYTSTGGLKMAYISGRDSISKTDCSSNFTTSDLKSLKDVCLKSSSNFRGVDLLLSSQWPAGITNHNASPNVSKPKCASIGISWLVTQVKPRYHVSGLEGIYYERPPFRSPGSGELEIVTRFIGLAKVGNSKKEKWMHALSLTPIDKMSVSQLIQKTTDETPCPYDVNELEVKVLGINKNKRAPAPSEQYFYDMSSPQEKMKSRGHVKRQRIEFDQSKCWFCLASPSLEKHLIVTVGDFMYLTLAKGGIVDEHFLICPIEHCQSSLGLSKEMSGELQKFKKAVRKFYRRKGEVPVFFERNYKTSHMQIQCVPVPKSAEGQVVRAFKDEADSRGLVLENSAPSGGLFFSAELPSGENVHIKIHASRDFPVNFGRQVLASDLILDKPDRIEWKDCVLKKESEEELVKKVRADFKAYDFTE